MTTGGTASTGKLSPGLEALAESLEASRTAQVLTNRGLEVELPLRYLRQQAHLTTPGSNAPLAQKAIGNVLGVAARLLDRYEISTAEVADCLGVGDDLIAELLSGDGSAPVVMLDLEDGVAPGAAAVAREQTVELLRGPGWGTGLRFLRPPGIDDERSVRDLVEVVSRAAGAEPESFPLDAIVFPKVKHTHEVEWLYSALDQLEQELGLPRNRIRVAYLVEAAWALHNLPDLAVAGRDRLAGLILGPADLSADVQLGQIHYRHPICEYARDLLVTVAGAVGVPAIDGMTLNFPVASSALPPAERKERILSRLLENFEDMRHSLERGLAGCWVGHPLQMLSTLAVFRAMFTPAVLEAEVAKLEEFSAALAAEQGAVAGGTGQLLDIATDRHTRTVLRRATAWGLFPKTRAVTLGVISGEEAGELP
jgi:citrate lyase beta subunit